MTDPKISDHIHAELLALQQLAAADIAFYKQQQWHVTNYALLLYAATVAATQIVPEPVLGVEYAFLWVVALIVLITGIYVIHVLDQSLANSRNRLPAARKHFNREISLRAYATEKEPDDALRKASEKPSLRLLFVFTLIVGFLLTSWILVRMWCST